MVCKQLWHLNTDLWMQYCPYDFPVLHYYRTGPREKGLAPSTVNIDLNVYLNL